MADQTDDQPTAIKMEQQEMPIDDVSKPETDKTAQEGVLIAEAITSSWSKSSLIMVYACMWLIYFTNAFRSSMASTLSPFVISTFGKHSLMPVIDVVSSIVAASVYMPLAKILNLWDRTFGFSIMVGLATLGMVLMASCNSFELYAAANVFYSIGFAGVIFSVDVMAADTSSLRSRGLAFAFTSSPFLITAFGGPKAAETIYAENWRWGYGAWAIVLPVVSLSMIAILRVSKRKAKQHGFLVNPRSGRTIPQSVWYYATEFDVIGVFLVMSGLVLFLLPFTIATSSADQWSTGYIIAMLVVGFLLLLSFCLWEKFFATVPFLPWHMLRSRTIIGGCCISLTYQIAYYCWNIYFTSYLQVVYDISMSSAGYIASIFDMVNGVNLFVVGFLIRFSGRYKWVFYWGVPIYILGEGLLIYFRQPNFSVGYTVMCQIFMALGGGVMILGVQVAVMSDCAHNEIAAALALLNMFGNIGGSLGNSISGAIWTNTLPQKLHQLLPDSAKDQWQDIYDDISMQLSFPMGSPERDAIIAAYGSTQRLMLIAGTSVMMIATVCVLVIRDINIKHSEQVKGMVF